MTANQKNIFKTGSWIHFDEILRLHRSEIHRMGLDHFQRKHWTFVDQIQLQKKKNLQEMFEAFQTVRS